jgi:8-oxo-dGTP diphosphatase
MTAQSAQPIRAAGGIVVGKGTNRGKIAIVRRRRYEGEISLPKGKAKEGEKDSEVALREVEEETGLRATLRELAGTTHYDVDGRRKTVTYFMMDAPEGIPASPHDSAEIESVEWLDPEQAIVALTHREDRTLIFDVFNIGLGSLLDEDSPNKKQRIWNAPERARLAGALRAFAIDLKYVPVVSRREEWWLSANERLNRARQYLAVEDFHQGWVSLNSAQRALLLDPGDPDRVYRTAVGLRRDLEKVSGRRAKAIRDLICDEKGNLLPNLVQMPRQVVEAVAYRDDQFETNYFKIALRRRHLFLLFLLLLAGILLTLILSLSNVLPEPFNQFGIMAGVVLFGTLGAGLSVARGLLVADISAKIPAQQIGAFVIWMRPAIGAAAALISFVLLSAKAFTLFNWDPKSPMTIFAVAIVAGFCERFIVGAIESIADRNEKPEGDRNKEKAKPKGPPDQE